MADDFNPAPAATATGTPTSTLWNLARGAKGIALLCFALPWVTVSCAGQPLARITGVQLATGSVPPIGQNAPGMPAAPGGAAATNYSVDIFALGAAVLIIAALVVTFVMARRKAALVATGASAVAAVLIVFDVFVRIKGAATAQLRQGAAGGTQPSGTGGEFERQMQQQAEQMVRSISVDPAIGFWLCVLALAVAIVLCNMVRTRPAAP